MKEILFVVSSHTILGNTGKQTGSYIPEIAHPYNILKDNFKITFASPKGGKAPIDPESLVSFKADPEVIAFLADKEAQQKINNTIKVTDVGDVSRFVAVVYPGGHGPVFDLYYDQTSLDICAKIYEQGGAVAAVCHGPASIVNVKLSNGTYLLQDKNVTGFSNTEEEAVNLTDAVPYSLENELAKKGKYTKAENWAAYAVVDGRIITGQNPASGKKVGEELLKLLTAN